MEVFWKFEIVEIWFMICHRDIMSLYWNINYNRVCKALHATTIAEAANGRAENRVILLVQ